MTIAEKWSLLQYFTLNRFFVYCRYSHNIRQSYNFSKIFKTYLRRNSLLIRLWLTVCNFTKEQTPAQCFLRTLLKLSKLLFWKQAFSGCSVLICYYIKIADIMNVDIIKQNPPRQYSILINDSNLREID